MTVWLAVDRYKRGIEIALKKASVVMEGLCITHCRKSKKIYAGKQKRILTFSMMVENLWAIRINCAILGSWTVIYLKEAY